MYIPNDNPNVITMVLSHTSQPHTVHGYARSSENVWYVANTSCTNELEGMFPMVDGGLSIRDSFYIPKNKGDLFMVVPLIPRLHMALVVGQTSSFICSGLSDTSYIIPSSDERKKGCFLFGSIGIQ